MWLAAPFKGPFRSTKFAKTKQKAVSEFPCGTENTAIYFDHSVLWRISYLHIYVSWESKGIQLCHQLRLMVNPLQGCIHPFVGQDFRMPSTVPSSHRCYLHATAKPCCTFLVHLQERCYCCQRTKLLR